MRKQGRRQRPVILVFGENFNDAHSIVALLIHVEPRLAGIVKPRPRPMSLTREAGSLAVRNWLGLVNKAVEAMERGGSSVRAVVVHRDADAPDPRGQAHRELAQQLTAVSVEGHPVVPVQELEAWWLMFPDAVESVRPQQWRDKVPRSDRDVERINDPKEHLKRLTRGKHGLAYQEADSPAIAQYIRDNSPQRHGTSASYDRLIDTARTLVGSKT